MQLSPNSQAGQLKQIKYVLYQKVQIEKIKKKDTVQYKNFQRLGNAASSCSMQYRCVKCCDAHAPGQCQINAEQITREKLYCVICQNYGHPASYKGCPKRIELIEKMKTQNQKLKHTTNVRPVQSRLREPNIRYSQVVRAAVNDPSEQNQKSQNKLLTEEIASLRQQLHTLIAIVSHNASQVNLLMDHYIRTDRNDDA